MVNKPENLKTPVLEKGSFEGFYSESKYCSGSNLMGHLVNSDGTKCKTSERRAYLPDDAKGHIAITPHSAIRWAIEEYTQPGDTVLDPFAGSGTTGIEAIFQDRLFVGSEFEFYEITEKVLNHFNPKGNMYGIYPGDAEEQLNNVPDESVQLVNLSNPYPGGDANQTTMGKAGRDYKDKNNCGHMRGEVYWNKMKAIQDKACEKLEVGGHVIFVIKDMVKNKKIWPLHEMLADIMPDYMEFQGTVLLEHLPKTLFQNTYQKQYPEVEHIPLEQICPLFRKMRSADA